MAAGHCERHAAERERDREEEYREDRERRGSASARGYGALWRRLRVMHLHAEPLCRECRREGRITAAVPVDHVIPHRMDAKLLRSPWNLQSLCEQHHRQKSARETDLWTGLKWPLLGITPARRATLVCGAPAAGKSTYAGRHAQPDDVVVDMDHLRAGRTLAEALSERNRLLAMHARRTGSMLWLVAMAMRHAEREHWRWQLGADVVTLLPGEDECRQRIEQRGRNVARLSEVNREWWQWQRLDAEHAERLAAEEAA